MKRYILLLVIAACNIAAYSQIQNKILGSTLGVTPKSTVIQRLKSRGYKINYVEKNTIRIDNVSFGGFTWASAYMDFHNGKLYVVDFSDSEFFTPKKSLNLRYESLSQSLDKKYSAYKEPEDDYATYSDGKNYVRIKYEYSEITHNWGISLMYINVALQESSVKESESEL